VWSTKEPHGLGRDEFSRKTDYLFGIGHGPLTMQAAEYPRRVKKLNASIIFRFAPKAEGRGPLFDQL
jgi:hypothetical protein